MAMLSSILSEKHDSGETCYTPATAARRFERVALPEY